MEGAADMEENGGRRTDETTRVIGWEDGERRGCMRCWGNIERRNGVDWKSGWRGRVRRELG